MNIWTHLPAAVVCLMHAPLLVAAQDELHSYGDYHQHLFSPAIAERSSNVPVFAQDLVKLLDDAGIQRAAVLSLAYQYGNPNRPPVENEYERVKAENDWTSKEVARFPDRLIGFCGVNPLRDYALEEIDRCSKDPQLRRGLKMHFGNSDVDLLNPQHVKLLQAVLRSANSHGMAIVVHMRATVSQKRPYGTAQARAFLTEVLPAAPDVPVQIAHLAGAGGYEDRLADEVMAVFADAVAARDPRVAKVLFDVSGIAGLGQWRTKMDLIVRRIREVGVERVLYGSDGAGGKNQTPRQAWAAFLELPLTKDEVRTIANNVAPYLR
jgi:predicted TIM-barrel fold metal-dependent hydrolase